mmetsp:Transcript_119897/g.344466  ORF Transcript_119897/g.344466 Transcript_119897/m.344466 type:complete len:207 (+) Transcript_119897:426-1046(+)
MAMCSSSALSPSTSARMAAGRRSWSRSARCPPKRPLGECSRTSASCRTRRGRSTGTSSACAVGWVRSRCCSSCCRPPPSAGCRTCWREPAGVSGMRSSARTGSRWRETARSTTGRRGPRWKKWPRGSLPARSSARKTPARSPAGKPAQATSNRIALRCRSADSFVGASSPTNAPSGPGPPSASRLPCTSSTSRSVWLSGTSQKRPA